jgi:malate/lactate dehydrogenase
VVKNGVIHFGNLGDFFVSIINHDNDEISFEDLNSQNNFKKKEEILRIYRSGGEIVKFKGNNYINLKG